MNLNEALQSNPRAEIVNTYTYRDSGNMKRRMGMFICQDCRKEFKGRLERIGVMTGLCLVCKDIEAGKKRTKHGHTNENSRLYVTWGNMKRRCFNPTEKEKRNYGEIGLCDGWLDFNVFMEWSLKNGYTDKNTIDRKDGSKGYTPDNCRFVDYSVQSANRKKTDKNTTGYIGVYGSPDGKWNAKVQWRKKVHWVGRFFDKKEAARARDLYIIQNNLPHVLNFSASSI